MSGLLNSRLGPSSPVFQGVLPPPVKSPAEPVYGVVLLDRHGGLLGASTASSLPGEVAMPPGLNLRTHDLRSYLSEDRGFLRPRRFPLVSATWVQVKSKRVRVGIYMEAGGTHLSSDGIDPDLGSVVAILSAQVG
jgi:hypothetical protein